MLQVLSENKNFLSEFDLKFVKSVNQFFNVNNKTTAKQYYKIRDIIFKLHCERNREQFFVWFEEFVNGKIDFNSSNTENDTDIEELTDLLN